MDQRERVVTGVSALAYLAVAGRDCRLRSGRAARGAGRGARPARRLALILQVRFEFGGYYASPEQLAFVPLLLIAPLPLRAALFAARGRPGRGPGHRSQQLAPPSLARHLLGLLGGARRRHRPRRSGARRARQRYFAVYLVAFAAHFLTDVSWTLLRNRLLDRLPLREVLRGFAGTARVDAILTPLAFVVSLAAVEQPLYLLAIAPAVWLLHLFSHDRRERYSKTLELHRAYRGTVMLLSDVIESEDTYTAQHSRLGRRPRQRGGRRARRAA